MRNKVKSKGAVQVIIKDKFGGITNNGWHNTVLRTSREALTMSLANEINSTYDFFISRMIFGDGGTSGSVPKFVTVDRNGLFGITRAIKPVQATIDPNITTQVTFTSILDYDEANGFVLSEMALQMNSGDFYSMATFADLSKTSAIQLTFNWVISMV